MPILFILFISCVSQLNNVLVVKIQNTDITFKHFMAAYIHINIHHIIISYRLFDINVKLDIYNVVVGHFKFLIFRYLLMQNRKLFF